MSLKNFSHLLNKKILVLTHVGADVDALASAAAIYFSLKAKAKISIGIPEHMNNPAALLAKKLEIPFSINPSLDGFDAVLCVDFSNSSQAGLMSSQVLSFGGEKFVVDHHSAAKQNLASAKNSLINKDAVSTTEIVYDMLRGSKANIPKKAYLCIACGIITDSSSFMVADHETFSIMSEVMEKSSSSYSDIISLFSVEKEFSQKVACLKAANRSKIFKSNDSIIAIADVGAFEADAASALVRVGADAAFCGFCEKGDIRVSGRVNNLWMKNSRIDLSKDVLSKLPEFFGGEGGGHPGAAGYNGKGEDVEIVLLKCVNLVHEFLVKNSNVKTELKEYN